MIIIPVARIAAVIIAITAGGPAIGAALILSAAVLPATARGFGMAFVITEPATLTAVMGVVVIVAAGRTAIVVVVLVAAGRTGIGATSVVLAAVFPSAARSLGMAARIAEPAAMAVLTAIVVITVAGVAAVVFVVTAAVAPIVAVFAHEAAIPVTLTVGAAAVAAIATVIVVTHEAAMGVAFGHVVVSRHSILLRSFRASLLKPRRKKVREGRSGSGTMPEWDGSRRPWMAGVLGLIALACPVCLLPSVPAVSGMRLVQQAAGRDVPEFGQII